MSRAFAKALDSIREREATRAEQANAQTGDREGEGILESTFLAIESVRAEDKAGNEHGGNERHRGEADAHAGEESDSAKKLGAGREPCVGNRKRNANRAKKSGEAVDPWTTEETEQFLSSVEDKDGTRDAPQQKQGGVMSVSIS